MQDSCHRITFIITNKLEEAHYVRSSIQAICLDLMIDQKTAFQMASCVIEIITEANNRSLNDKQETIQIDFHIKKDSLILIVSYGGKPLSTERVTELNAIHSKSNPMEVKELGFYLLKVNLDEVQYDYQNEKNTWTLTKKVTAYGAQAR